MKSIVDGIRIFLAVAMPYFRSEDAGAAALLLAAVVGRRARPGLCGGGGDQWNARFFNALEAKNWAAFQRELVAVLLHHASARSFAGMSQYYFGQTLQIRWRRWLTERYVAIWMAEGRHYRVRFVDNTVDNIHLRIANDVYLFIQRTHELGTGLLSSIVALVSFAYHPVGPLGDHAAAAVRRRPRVPGLSDLVAALAYAGIGTLIAHWIGWRLIPLQFNQQRYEVRLPLRDRARRPTMPSRSR